MRWFSFLWWDCDRRDAMAHIRATAFLALSHQPATMRDLYCAVQREMYRAAREDGWSRERNEGMRYAERVVMAGLMPRPEDVFGEALSGDRGALRPSVVRVLAEMLTPVELGVLAGILSEMEVPAIAAELGLSESEVRAARRSMRRKLRVQGGHGHNG